MVSAEDLLCQLAAACERAPRFWFTLAIDGMSFSLRLMALDEGPRGGLDKYRLIFEESTMEVSTLEDVLEFLLHVKHHLESSQRATSGIYVTITKHSNPLTVSSGLASLAGKHQSIVTPQQRSRAKDQLKQELKNFAQGKVDTAPPLWTPSWTPPGSREHTPLHSPTHTPRQSVVHFAPSLVEPKRLGSLPPPVPQVLTVPVIYGKPDFNVFNDKEIEERLENAEFEGHLQSAEAKSAVSLSRLSSGAALMLRYRSIHFRDGAGCTPRRGSRGQRPTRNCSQTTSGSRLRVSRRS